MSFATEAKSELCRIKADRRCCAVAEAYGILLFCNTFSPNMIKITTTCTDFAERLPKLFRKAFGVSFDFMTESSVPGKKNLTITDREKLRVIFDSFGTEMESFLAHHVNFGVIEEDCCRMSFVRGAFLSGGSVTDPDKRYHLELATSHQSVTRETVPILMDMGIYPKESSRGANALLYFKQSDTIADFLTAIGASTTAMKVMTAKVEKEMRNTITRQINCDSANADKTVMAAQEQLAAIRRYASDFGLDSLPDALHDAALLRITNPEASLSDLAKLSYPPVTKSCLSHRLKKIMSLAPEENE